MFFIANIKRIAHNKHNEEKKPLTQETTLENLHHRRTEVCQLFRLTGANKMQQETLK